MPHVELPNDWQPRWYQYPLWNALQNEGKRRVIEIAHRRWGKDDVFLHHTAIEAFKRPATYWHCLPEYEQSRKAIWNAVNPHTGKRRVHEAFPPVLIENMNEQEMFIRFKTGSTWQVIGSDRYDSLVGAGVAGVTFSEWALCNPSAWGYIKPMVEENGGYAAFITTPRGNNHAKAMYDMARTDPAWFAEISPISKTRALTDEQLASALKEYIALFGHDLGTAQFEQEYHCSFDAAVPGAYYGREMAQVAAEGRITSVDVIDGFPVHTAWDLGKGQNMAIWCFQIVGRTIRVVDFFSGHATYIPDYVKLLKDKGYDGADIVPHDARVPELGTGRTRVEEMMALGRKPIVCPMHTKDDGINAVRQTLPRCVFDEVKTAYGLEALRQYQREWDDDRKVFKRTDFHNWASHPADAFRYLSMAWRIAVPQPKPVPKPQELRFEVNDAGQVVSNMSVRQIVEAKARARERDW